MRHLEVVNSHKFFCLMKHSRFRLESDRMLKVETKHSSVLHVRTVRWFDYYVIFLSTTLLYSTLILTSSYFAVNLKAPNGEEFSPRWHDRLLTAARTENRVSEQTFHGPNYPSMFMQHQGGRDMSRGRVRAVLWTVF
jgi:hypothetical protein